MKNGDGPKRGLLKFYLELSQCATRHGKDNEKVVRLFGDFMSIRPEERHELNTRHNIIIKFETPNVILVEHTEKKELNEFESQTVKSILEKTILDGFKNLCSKSFSADTVSLISINQLI
jgi:hypothetical protein